VTDLIIFAVAVSWDP